ncbi:SpoIIE family protein phosphatase [Streptomyces sp. 4N509B]|uniref:SpoIIE family protein phosphatase n=1 Tax=Streptomyces sp. 4N509B TaxID=3457413 RepID=UPI003FD46627
MGYPGPSRDVPGAAGAPAPSSGGPTDPGPAALGPALDAARSGAVLIDGRGRVLLWSPLAEQVLGWTAHEAVGLHLAALLPEGHPSAVPVIHRTLLREHVWRGTLRLRHRDDGPVEVAVTVSLLVDGAGTPFILANLVDAGPTTVAQGRLAALDTLEAFFAASPLGIALLDTDRRFVRVNDALLRLHGAAAERLLGRTVAEALPPPVSHELDKALRQALRTGDPVVDLITTAPDGTGTSSVSVARLTDADGRTLGLSCTVMDVTGRRQALTRVEQARQNLALLDDVGTALGNLLDVRQVAEALAGLLVPRFADYASVAVLRPVVRGGRLPSPEALPDQTLVRLAGSAKREDPAVERLMTEGQDVAVTAGHVLGNALINGTPTLFTSEEEIRAAAPDDDKAAAARELGIHSMITAPLPARGTLLGALTLTRAERRAAFDQRDIALVTEIAARAGVYLDNARLYARERERALMLQRSLLPRAVPEPPGVTVGYRYVPSAIGAEAGGDWFDVIPLHGGRVALVIGDVTGHGLRPAATMGRLRTAVRTLSALDLSPAELLARVNALSSDIAQHPDDPLLATCLYAVYDPASHSCTLANAGHLPPVLCGVDPERPASGHLSAEVLRLPPGAPLGLEGTRFEERRLAMPHEAVLVLYTDGLVESRGGDIGDGIERLRSLLVRASRPGVPLEPLCDTVVATLNPQSSEDDIALLMARLGHRSAA